MDMNVTEIMILLDRSGSMQSVKAATIDGINEFLSQQKSCPGKAYLTLIQFDDQYEVVYDRVNIMDVAPLTDETYIPRGMTALIDSWGRSIDELGVKLAALSENERPGKVLVTVITDGLDNAHLTEYNYTREQVAEKVRHQQDKYSWNFIFIGANQDAILTAQDFGIKANNALTYNTTVAGTKAMSTVYTSAVSCLRSGGSSQVMGFSADEQNYVAETK